MSARAFSRILAAVFAFLFFAVAAPTKTFADSYQVIGTDYYYVNDQGGRTRIGAAGNTGDGTYTFVDNTGVQRLTVTNVGGTNYVTQITNVTTGDVTTFNYDPSWDYQSPTTVNDPTKIVPDDAVGKAFNEAEKKVKDTIPDPISKIMDFIIAGYGRLLELIGYSIWVFASSVLWVAAQIMNFGFDALVNKMGSYTSIWEAVRSGWIVIRDIGNTLFIFVLLYAAFNTVLGRKDGLDLVPRIIVVALLVNFSYLFATEIIDASNTLASKVYTELVGGTDVKKGFSGKLAELSGALEFTEAQITDAVAQSGANTSGATKSALGGFSYFIRAIFQSMFMLTLGGFMLAIVFTLIARFVTLIVLCLVSALAFLSYLLPKFRQHSNDWWKALVGQAFYAPAIFLMLLITVGIAEKIGKSPLVTAAKGTGANAQGNFETLFSFGIGQFFNFVILMGLLYASMVMAKKISEQGSSAAISIGQRAQKTAAAAAFGGAGWAGRGAFGRIGSALQNNDAVKNMSVQTGITGAIGRRLVGVGGKMQDSSFDFRKTGAAAALGAATGADYGKVSDLASKGYRGAVEARDKVSEERIEAVRKNMDISKDDKLKKIDELAKREGAGSAFGAAHSVFESWKTALETEERALATARAGGNAAAITAAESRVATVKTALESAKNRREEEGYKVLNKEIFNVETEAGKSADRDMNHSVKYAQSRGEDAQKRGRGSRNLKWALGGAAGGVATMALAPLAPAAFVGAAAVGSTFAAGRAIHGTLARIRGTNASQIAASEKHVKSYGKVVAARTVVEKLDADEKARSIAFAAAAARPGGAAGMLQGLTRAEETERRKAQSTIDKAENAGKKKDD